MALYILMSTTFWRMEQRLVQRYFDENESTSNIYGDIITFQASKVNLSIKKYIYLHYCWSYEQKSWFGLEWDILYIKLNKRIAIVVFYAKIAYCDVYFNLLKFVLSFFIHHVEKIIIYSNKQYRNLYFSLFSYSWIAIASLTIAEVIILNAQFPFTYF